VSGAQARVELTGVQGVPETALSELLLASLPLNQFQAPWECHCTAVVWLHRGGRAAAAALPSGLAGSPALAVVGGFVRYTDTPVGPYDEVLGVVGSRTGLRPWGHVAFMAVDSKASLVGGRTNWAMPKTLARFDGEPANGRTMSGAGNDQIPWSVSANPRVIGLGIPVKAKGIARQGFGDGRVGESLLTLAGRARPAVVTVKVSSAATLAPWLRPGLHMGAVIDRATITLGVPAFR
jgi:Acetoacetate decarboxylase (ADC)